MTSQSSRGDKTLAFSNIVFINIFRIKNRMGTSMTFSRRRFLRHSALATTTLIATPAVFRSGAFGAENPIVVGSLHDQFGPIAASGHADGLRAAACRG